MHLNKPRIFISHAWEDKALVRRLEAELQAAGAEVWVDHVGIRGGDNLPERISEALEWCNTLLLIWSDAASQSRWVKLEWTNAISLEKRIVPCRLSLTPLPAILANKACLDFHNNAHGITKLLQALNLSPKPNTPTATDAHSDLTDQLNETPPPTKTESQRTSLYGYPLEQLSVDAVKKMLKRKSFFDKKWNVQGRGQRHQYKVVKRDGKKW
ncbi:MAG: toll/interleukin-1 receptor domain-containing protein [bacterium]